MGDEVKVNTEIEAMLSALGDPTPADLKAAFVKIKNNAADLTVTEKKYLAAYYGKRKEAIEA